MKISHLFFMGLAAATAVSCSNDALDGGSEGAVENGQKTRITVSAAIRTSGSETRAANAFEQKYNYLGELAGNDVIGNLDVFIGGGLGTTTTLHKNFAATAYDATSLPRVFPKADEANAIEVSFAKKQVNVVLNAAEVGTRATDLVNWLKGATTSTELTRRFFDARYDLNAMDLAASKYATAPTTAVSGVATTKSVGGEVKDHILMTSEDRVAYTIADGVSAATTVAAAANTGIGSGATKGAPSPANRFARDIRRAASRVYVTTAKDVTTDNYEITDEKSSVIGKVSSLQYVVGQGERAFYVAQKRVDANTGLVNASYAGSLNDEVRTPGYDYKNAIGGTSYDFTTTDSGAIAHYDYATLWMDAAGGGSATRHTAQQLRAGVPVTKRNAGFTTSEVGAGTDVARLLDGTLFLPGTHQQGTNAVASGHTRGNTAYVLIRGKFTPTKFEDDGTEVYLSKAKSTAPYYEYDGTKTTIGATGAAYDPARPTQTAGDEDGTFYRVNDGKFYRTLEGAIKSFNATAATPSGVSYTEDGKNYIVPTGSYIQRFPAGKMLWTLWVNPEQGSTDFNAPTVRNNIYAIHISDIKGVGANWNSLVPLPYEEKAGKNIWNDMNNKWNPDPNPNYDARVGGTPGTPNDPEDPTNPDDPTVPPVNPEDPDTPNNPNNPLPDTKTNISVEAGVLPWQVHGYSTSL